MVRVAPPLTPEARRCYGGRGNFRPMDNLAHALAGAALGRATADGRVPRAALLGALAANLPDLTELLYRRPLRGITYLELHRGFTHSFAGAALEIAAGTALVGIVLAWRARKTGGTV